MTRSSDIKCELSTYVFRDDLKYLVKVMGVYTPGRPMPHVSCPDSPGYDDMGDPPEFSITSLQVLRLWRRDVTTTFLSYEEIPLKVSLDETELDECLATLSSQYETDDRSEPCDD